MNKNLFLKQLRLQLRSLPEEELEAILLEYESYFDEAKANGYTETETINQLGSAQEIAKNILNQTSSPHHEVNSSDSIRQGIITIGLILFNLIIVVGPFVGIAGLFFGLTVMCSAFIVSPILSIGSIIVGNGSLFEFFLSLILLGVGMLLLPVVVRTIQSGIKLVNRYVQWNLRMVRGELR